MAVGFSIAPASAEDGPAAGAKRMFSIAPQPLARAIVSFSKAAGVDVVGDAGVVREARSRGAVGLMTAEEALRRITAGTGAGYRFTDATTVALEAPQVAPMQQEGTVELDEINVQGRGGETATGPVEGYVAKRSATATKTDTPILETPQSISVVPRDQITFQQTQTVSETLRYTAGVNSELYGTSAEFADIIKSRGFQSSIYRDGLKIIGTDGYNSLIPQADPYFLERVEVMRGPASVLYGQSSPAGIVNVISKRPTEDAIREILFEAGSPKRIGAAFDVGGSANENGSVLYRVTGRGFGSEGTIDDSRRERFAIAPAVTFKPNDNTSLTLLANYMNDPKIGRSQYVSSFGSVQHNPFGKFDLTRNFGNPDVDGGSRETASLTSLFEHKFNDDVTVRQSVRYQKTKSDLTEHFWFSAGPTDSLTTTYFRSERELAAFNADQNAEINFATGPIAHKVLVGLDYLNGKIQFDRYVGSVFTIFPFSDDNYQTGVPTFPDDPSSSARSTIRQTGVYLQDQIAFGQFRLTLGGRYDWAETTNRTTTNVGVRTLSRSDDTAFSGRVGLVYLFENGLTPYLSYAESFEPVQTASTSATTFKPTTGQLYEAGVKFQPVGSQSLFTAAVFDVTQQNVTVVDPNDLLNRLQAGEIRSRGVELEGKIEFEGGWSALAAYSYTHAEVTKGEIVAGVVKKDRPTVPFHMASFWLDHDFSGALDGLRLGAGVRYTGRSWGDDANTFKVPGVTLFDASASYEFGSLSERLNGFRGTLSAQNIADKKFVSSCLSALYCNVGQGRRFYATLSYKW